ncbi:MAG: ABC transporter ATP-binding protein [Actinobacteria bacterium]|jgi:NitT/TauT family transport system ATP-binding protein|nr:ABC transporter ATP-binding protein [Actinomycetota bacterium]
MSETAVSSDPVAVVASPSDAAPILRIRGVGKVFGSGPAATVALHDVDLDVARGEFLSVVGASGCGKSTLLNLIAGLDKPTSGTLEVGAKVAFMFQDATLLPWLTARQNIELALKLSGVAKRDRRARAEDLLATVRLDGRGDSRPHELSGGMRQRVALARCLAQDAGIVLMDEPLGALDAMTRDLLHDEIESVVRAQGLTVVFVTHNMREAIRLGDRVVLMGSHPGRILYDEDIPLPHPRQMDSTEVATRAASLTARLKAQGHTHVG